MTQKQLLMRDKIEKLLIDYCIEDNIPPSYHLIREFAVVLAYSDLVDLNSIKDEELVKENENDN